MGKAATRKTWQLQEAKNRFSHVVDEALKHGPQVITRRGVETAVVVSVEEYRKLGGGEKNEEKGKGSFLEFLRNSPLWGVELDIERSKDTGRDIEL